MKMTLSRSVLPLATFALLAFAGLGVEAAPVKTYQVTGPVLEVTDTTITVEKDKEKWQITRDKDTKVTGEIKAGSKVTIQYRMSAASIEVKPGDAKADKSDKVDTKAAAKPAKEKAAK